MYAASVYHDDACAISLIVRRVGGEVENDVSEHFVANTVGESCHGLFVACIDGLHGIIISALWKRLPVGVGVTTLLKVSGQFRPCLFIGCVGRGKAIDVVAYAILYGFQWSCWLCSLHLVVVLIIVERGLFVFVLLHVARHETSRLCDVVLGHTVRSAYGADHKVAMHVLALLVVQVIIGACCEIATEAVGHCLERIFCSVAATVYANPKPTVCCHAEVVSVRCLDRCG